MPPFTEGAGGFTDEREAEAGDRDGKKTRINPSRIPGNNVLITIFASTAIPSCEILARFVPKCKVPLLNSVGFLTQRRGLAVDLAQI